MDLIKAQVVVIGAGPGGYAAAFYAADQGKQVILIEKDEKLGGVCLNRGCIPSKALLHASKMIHEAKESEKRGISFGDPKIELGKLRDWKNSILAKLAGGIVALAKSRGVEVMHGRGIFEDSHTLRVETSSGQKFIRFEHAIIATGSRAALPRIFDLGNPRIMTSRGALEVEEIPQELLVIGGGYIGMELGSVYAMLGSRVTLVEALPAIIAAADPDLVRPVAQYAADHFKEVRLNTKIVSMSTKGAKIQVTVEFPDGTKKDELYDRVLVSVGRVPSNKDLGLENTKVELDEKGFIKVNNHQQTKDTNIFAIGDCVGGMMLAHKASKEARVAVEVITGSDSLWDNFAVPAVVFTDPEIAWVGLTEQEARQQGKKIKVAKFPWSASGRALTYDRTDGLTKIIVCEETERVLGVGIVGHGAGELIGEGALALEMGATVRDIAETIHAHPTLSETLMESAEAFFGHATHLTGPKRTH